MKPAGPMLYSQGLSNNSYPELNQPDSSHRHLFFLRRIQILSSHLRLGLPESSFPVGLSVKMLKEILLSSILAT